MKLQNYFRVVAMMDRNMKAHHMPTYPHTFQEPRFAPWLNKPSVIWTGEIVQLVNEDLSPTPRTHAKESHVWWCVLVIPVQGTV